MKTGLGPIEAVIFDMDGVLIDAREWHFQALNAALELFGAKIAAEEHMKRFDGLPTREKLATLTAEGRLPSHVHRIVNSVKQDRTLRIAAGSCTPRIDHLILMAWLKQHNYLIGVATNSIRQTSETMLRFAGLRDSLQVLVTNEDVKQAKPSSEIYLKTASMLGVDPSRVVVVEDHDVGVRAARAAGCRVVQVAGVHEVTVSLLEPLLMGKPSTGNANE